MFSTNFQHINEQLELRSYTVDDLTRVIGTADTALGRALLTLLSQFKPPSSPPVAVPTVVDVVGGTSPLSWPGRRCRRAPTTLSL